MATSEVSPSRHAERGKISPAPSASPVPDFLRAFRTGGYEATERFLHEEVVYRVDGFEPIAGRRAVMAYWRRMFEVHEALAIALIRHVRDGDVVLAAQRQLYLARGRPLVVLDTLAVFELEDERIRLWSDHLDGEVPAEEAALWRRLRAARW